MTDNQHDQDLDAPLDVEPADGDRVDADQVEGNVPTDEGDTNPIKKLLREGADALDAADIEEPDKQL
jgi:hypothetical protein